MVRPPILVEGGSMFTWWTGSYLWRQEISFPHSLALSVLYLLFLEIKIPTQIFHWKEKQTG